MKRLNILIICILVVVLAPPAAIAKGPPASEAASNNLSFPVIWAEGVTKAVPGTVGMTPLTGGAWWYSWGTNGTDPNVVPASCAPDPDNTAYCNNGILGTVNEALVPGTPPADNPMPLVRAYLQKDARNTWQAASATWSASPVSVDKIDWGDNLESNDWYTRSQVRTEVVLFEDLMEAAEMADEPEGRDVGTEPWLEYAMRHVSGWGIDEVHGMAAMTDTLAPILGPGNQATIYSPCARFTIQKLLVKRDSVALADLAWVSGSGWTEKEGSTVDLINAPIFSKAVYEGGDGPGYYSAEINVKGRVIFGYTWNVRQLNDPSPDGPAGDYRLTFSFDQSCGTVDLNTFFVDGVTEILVPVETEEVAASAEPVDEGGGTAVLDFADNLTYMDVRILDRGGSGGGGGKRPREMFMEQERYRYCQEGEGECCEDGSVCLAVRERTGELAQLQARIECEGAICQQFQARLQELVQTLNHVRLRSCTSEGECTCTCANGEDCLQLQDQIREVERLRDGTCDQCTDGDCPCDVELLDAVGAALYDLALSLANPAQSDFLFLPVLAKDE